MKLKYVAIGLILFAITACMRSTPNSENHASAKDTLNYNYKVYKIRAPDCGNKADSNCTVILFKYPFFNGQKALNDTVTSRLLSIFDDDNKPATSFDKLAKTLLTDYQNFKQDPKNPIFYTLDGYSKVLGQDSSLITLQTGGYTYQGGAHGASYSYFINWNTKAAKSITLNDLFKAGYEDKLKNIGEAIFRKNEHLSDTASLANGYFFKGNQFALNNNFLITPTGISFLYNNYEIKSYAQGTTDLVIPYIQIKSLIQPNTVLAQYIK